MGLPSTVFILTGFIRTLPNELEDAARMDGASELRIMWSVMLPLVRPAMVIAAIQNVVPIWNDFFFPLVFIQNDALKTLPQGLTTFMGEYTTDWGVLFAGLTLSAAPDHHHLHHPVAPVHQRHDFRSRQMNDLIHQGHA